MSDSSGLLEIQYANLEQQGDTAEFGMWVLLVNETIFFGALISTYFLYRISYPQEFAAAASDSTRRGWPPIYVPSAGIFQTHQGGP
jgi:heme/copper-type cytochrome/quinol oxidase subunit 3